jgi:hypothetical protein
MVLCICAANVAVVHAWLVPTDESSHLQQQRSRGLEQVHFIHVCTAGLTPLLSHCVLCQLPQAKRCVPSVAKCLAAESFSVLQCACLAQHE